MGGFGTVILMGFMSLVCCATAPFFNLQLTTGVFLDPTTNRKLVVGALVCYSGLLVVRITWLKIGITQSAYSCVVNGLGFSTSL